MTLDQIMYFRAVAQTRDFDGDRPELFVLGVRESAGDDLRGSFVAFFRVHQFDAISDFNAFPHILDHHFLIPLPQSLVAGPVQGEHVHGVTRAAQFLADHTAQHVRRADLASGVVRFAPAPAYPRHEPLLQQRRHEHRAVVVAVVHKVQVLLSETRDLGHRFRTQVHF